MPKKTKESLLQRYPKALIHWYEKTEVDIQLAVQKALERKEKPPKKMIYIPAWYDVIHLVDEKQLSKKERRKRQVARIMRMKESPTPEIAKSLVTIATAIDDIQDFTTAIGVGTRIIGRVYKPANVLAKGSFTAGECLNSLNLNNKIPWDRLTHRQLRDMIKHEKINLNKLPEYELKNLDKALKKIHPDWDMLKAHEKANWMRARYKMTRKRWGMPLKRKKYLAELLYSRGTTWGKIKIQVDKRLKRLLPTHGEMLEIAQTSDMLAGVGISFGPLVGFVLDAIFGVAAGAKWKRTKQRPSEAEMDAIQKFIEELAQNVQDPLGQIRQAGDILTKVVYSWATLPEDAIDHALTTIWAGAQATCATRGKKLWESLIKIGGEVGTWKWMPGAHTSVEIRESLALAGIDHTREEPWPGINIPMEATIQEVCEAYLPVIQRQTNMFRKKLSGTIEGEFLDACLDAIATNTAAAISEDGTPIDFSFAPELKVYTRAIDYGLEPPIYSTDEDFQAWHKYVMDYVQFFDVDGPPYDLLERAYNKFFPLTDILED